MAARARREAEAHVAAKVAEAETRAKAAEEKLCLLERDNLNLQETNRGQEERLVVRVGGGGFEGGGGAAR